MARVVPPTEAELPGLAAAASRGDRTASAALRRAGPRGLGALLAAYDAIPLLDVAGRAVGSEEIDAVARQKDARASRLYWYTDLEQAKAASRASGKPILSLRLLGQLDDELSCANSRFFRTALYPNHEVNALLRDRFLLHWSTERPAPVVTIDFRDGRTIKRTVTGNSLHYVLDGEGRVLDAIPGLWGPKAFARVLDRDDKLAHDALGLSDSARTAALVRHHSQAILALRAAWPREVRLAGLGPIGFPADGFPSAPLPSSAPRAAPPPAALAMNVAPSKAAVEMPMLKGTMRPTTMTSATLAELAATVPWALLAPAHLEESRLDEPSLALVRSKTPRSWSDPQSMGRPLRPEEVTDLVHHFEGLMAEDTAKNAYLHHAVIHRWLADAIGGRTGDDAFALLNARIYAELFKTPATDPWLGLVPPSVYTAIQDDGIVR